MWNVLNFLNCPTVQQSRLCIVHWYRRDQISIKPIPPTQLVTQVKFSTWPGREEGHVMLSSYSTPSAQ